MSSQIAVFICGEQRRSCAEPALRLLVEPLQSLEHVFRSALHRIRRADPLVEELDDADSEAAASLVRRNDQIPEAAAVRRSASNVSGQTSPGW